MDFDMLSPGMKGIKEEQVTESNIARSYGSGGLEVYATPAMVALMEGACVAAVDKALPEGYSTVGSRLTSIEHSSPTPPGMTVRASGELLAVEGRRLRFRVEARDDAGTIGTGTHERFIVNNAQFLAKAGAKKGAPGL
jgi:predicted thioesterase